MTQRTPRLKIDYENGDGDVVFPEEWYQLSTFMQADILNSWIQILSYEYKKSWNAFGRGQERINPELAENL